MGDNGFMHCLKMDKEVLEKHRKWTGAIYPDVVSDLANGCAQYQIIRSNGKTCDYPVSADELARKYFAVLSRFFGCRKNLTCEVPSKLYDYVKAVDQLHTSEKLKIRSRSEILKCTRNYCENLFSYKEFCDGNILVRDASNKNILKWVAPDEGQESIDALNFIRSLRISVCPYCNAHSLNIKKNFPRSELDHYYPKAYYPCLAISLYNLVPSCTECNQKLKGSKIPDYAIHYNPYDKKDDYHKNVVLRNAAGSGLEQLYRDKVKLSLDRRNSKCSSRPLAFRHIIDYLGRYEQAYRDKYVEVWNLYPLAKTSYKNESVRRVAKADKDFAKRYFTLCYKASHINKNLLSKVAIDAVDAREKALGLN